MSTLDAYSADDKLFVILKNVKKVQIKCVVLCLMKCVFVIKLQVMKCVLLEIDCFEILDRINFLENVVEQVLSAVLKKVSDFLNVTKNGQ